MIAQLASQTNIHSQAKAGVMIRESLDADARHAALVRTAGGRIATLGRATTGGSGVIYDTSGGSLPIWLKVERSGNTFTSSYSADGQNWTLHQTGTLALANTLYVGLVVTAYDNSALSTATFTDVSVTGSGSPTSTPTATSSPTPTATLSLTASPTASPTPTNTPTSTPGPTATPTATATPAPDIVIQRSTYRIAGHMVAVRVTGDPDNNNNGLFYYYSDHLGSTAVIVRGSTGFVIGGVARYLPFGNYRTTPTQTATDRHFTGHKHNDDLGLVYMNARFYVPSVGRFVSADTQSFKRYDVTGCLRAVFGDMHTIRTKKKSPKKRSTPARRENRGRTLLLATSIVMVG